MMKYVKIARPDHWVKNVFILPGIVIAVILIPNASHSWSILSIITGLFSACFIASANYTINEWLDVKSDRYHPVKKHRVLVGENINVKIIILEYAILSVLGLFLAFQISGLFFITALSLLVMGLIYNVKPLRTKDIPYMDVLTESVNNAIRLLLGWFIVTSLYLPPVSLVTGYWMGGAFLMGTKRYAEYRMINDPQIAGSYRKSFQRYTEVNLLVSSIFYALTSVFFIGVFLIKHRIELILFMPFLCGLYCLYLLISYKEDSAVQKPEKLYTERGLILYVIFLAVLFTVLMIIDIPQLSFLIDGDLVLLTGFTGY